MASAAVAVQTADTSLGRPLPVKLSRIRPYPDQPRKWFDAASVEALADAIEADGQETPVKICKDPQYAGNFMLIDGERRWRAFQVIWQRTGKEPLVEAFFDDVKNAKAHFRKSFIANLHRADLAPLDTAAAFHRLHEDGDSHATLAKIVGKSTTYVQGYLALHTLPDAVKEMMNPDLPKEEQLSVTQATIIARGIPKNNPDLRITVAREAITRALGIVDTRSMVESIAGGDRFRAGFDHRKPSDDYAVFRSFLGRTAKRAESIVKLDIDYLYRHRDLEKDDREYDSKMLDVIISRLQTLQRKVDGRK